jgi:hypothetical protein
MSMKDKGIDLPALLADNVGPDGVSVFDLDRVTMPSGGGLSFTVPDIDKGEKAVNEIKGIIVAYQDVRAYWQQGLDESGGGTPPDCSSDDCRLGVGEPGGQCKQCPMAQFGTASNGKGQACTQRRRLFILRENDIMPIMVSLPPTSLKPIKQYFWRLATHRYTSYYKVITKLGLAKIPGADPPYSVIVPSIGEALTDQQIAIVTEISESVRNTIACGMIGHDDYVPAEAIDAGE